MLDKIYNVVLNNPDSLAYRIGNKSISYRELWDISDYYADMLKRQGTTPVIIYGNKDIDVIVSILSCLKAKRTYVPVSLTTPLKRIESILSLTKSDLVLTNNNKIDNVLNLSLNELDKYKNDKIKENNNKYAYIIFTSGTTGEPKGVPISYANLDNFIGWINSLYPLNEYVSPDFKYIKFGDCFYPISNSLCFK